MPKGDVLWVEQVVGDDIAFDGKGRFRHLRETGCGHALPGKGTALVVDTDTPGVSISVTLTCGHRMALIPLPLTPRRRIMAFLDGAITKGTETTPREILNMLAVALIFMLVYAWLEEIQALVGHPFG